MSRSQRLGLEQAQALVLDTEPWLSCEDCFDLMDGYVEDILEGRGGEESVAMRVHLAGCAACAEEADSLLELVGSER